MQQAVEEAGRSMVQIGAIISEIASGSAALVTVMHEQADSGRVISRNVSGTACDLDGIGSRAAQLDQAAVGVDSLARRVGVDSVSVENSAAAIDRALSLFFERLHA
jgi:methyl-accepting chemotaxis protein